jgi:hypothetical protein
MTDRRLTLNIDTVREVAGILRNLPPRAIRDLSTLLPISGVRGVVDALAESIEKLPEQLDADPRVVRVDARKEAS